MKCVCVFLCFHSLQCVALTSSIADGTKWQSVLSFVLFPTLFAALVNKIYRLFLLTGPYQFYWAKPRLFYFSSDCVVGKIEPTSSWPNKTDTGLLAKIDYMWPSSTKWVVLSLLQFLVNHILKLNFTLFKCKLSKKNLQYFHQFFTKLKMVSTIRYRTKSSL